VTVAVANADGSALPADLAPGDYVRVSVSDTGTGMPDEVRARVFEPFFTTKPHGRGTGLGLPMVRTMAEAAGGCVTIDSHLGEGTSVHLWLPRAATGAEDRSESPSVGRVGPLRILIAEDDPEVSQMLCEQLLQAGHRLEAVESARAAIDRLSADSGFDLLITDFAMPRLSGLDLAKRVAADWPRVPVLLVTGFAEIEEEVDLVVLTKPFTGAQLEAAVAQAVKAGAASASAGEAASAG
jgi:CheY-like chemotaxis protein